jgi:hypothetical protein
MSHWLVALKLEELMHTLTYASCKTAKYAKMNLLPGHTVIVDELYFVVILAFNSPTEHVGLGSAALILLFTYRKNFILSFLLCYLVL